MADDPIDEPWYEQGEPPERPAATDPARAGGDRRSQPPAGPPSGGRPPGGPAAPGPERSWQGATVGLAIAIGVVLLLVAVAVIVSSGGDDDPEVASTTTSAPGSTQPGSTLTTAAGQPPVTEGPATTRKATPLSIVAADDRRVVVLDQSGSAPPRTLFDLGPSSPNDTQPPFIGGVAFAPEGSTVYFDIAGNPESGMINRVPLAGGKADEIGPGVAPAPSPDGSMLALLKAPEPDVPATLVLRQLTGGSSERRIELGDGSCGNLAWSPNRREVAVDLCSQEEPVSVAIVDVATAGVRTLTPPEGTTWSVPAFKDDGTLTLVEQRDSDAAVVTLKADRTSVASTLLRRPSTRINTIDWSSAGDLLVCDQDAIVIAAIGGTQAQQVATGYTAAAW